MASNCLTFNNGVHIPFLGYGTFLANDTELELAVEAALEAGYRHIDTAAGYENEKVVGRVLHRWLSSKKLKREDLFIVTKLPPTGNRPMGVSKFLKRSLENLQVDYVDLYLIHVPFTLRDIEGNFLPMTANGKIDMDVSTDLVAIWKEMEKQVPAGLTKSIGISNFNKSQIQRILGTCTIKPQSLQIELHAYFQQKELVNFCKEHDLIVTAYSPLGSPGLAKFLNEKVELPNILGNPVVKAVSQKHNKSAAQILLRHCIQKGIVAIPKSTNPKRLRENIDIFNFELDGDDMEKLNGLDHGPDARIVNFKSPFVGIENHPEYPF